MSRPWCCCRFCKPKRNGIWLNLSLKWFKKSLLEGENDACTVCKMQKYWTPLNRSKDNAFSLEIICIYHFICSILLRPCQLIYDCHKSSAHLKITDISYSPADLFPFSGSRIFLGFIAKTEGSIQAQAAAHWMKSTAIYIAFVRLHLHNHRDDHLEKSWKSKLFFLLCMFQSEKGGKYAEVIRRIKIHIRTFMSFYQPFSLLQAKGCAMPTSTKNLHSTFHPQLSLFTCSWIWK